MPAVAQLEWGRLVEDRPRPLERSLRRRHAAAWCVNHRYAPTTTGHRCGATDPSPRCSMLCSDSAVVAALPLHATQRPCCWCCAATNTMLSTCQHYCSTPADAGCRAAGASGMPMRHSARRRVPIGDRELLVARIDKDEFDHVRAGGAAPPTPPEPKEALQHIICFLVLMCLLL